MLHKISLLTALFIVCYFIGNCPRVVATSTITRYKNQDTFTGKCGLCHKIYGAVCITAGVDGCRCGTHTSVFLRSKNSCASGGTFMKNEKCFLWTAPEILQVIDVEGSLSSYIYFQGVKYQSCSVQSVSYYNKKGIWQQLAAVGGDVLESTKQGRNAVLKVVGNSPELIKYKGYVIKVGLSCTLTLQPNTEEDGCLLFKAKGTLEFHIFNFTTSTCTSSCAVTAVTTSTSAAIQSTPSLSTGPVLVTSVNHGSLTSTSYPATATPGTSTVPPSQQTTGSSLLPGTTGHNKSDNIAVTLIATTGALLCVIIICAVVWAVHRYKFRSRAMEARNYDCPLAVIPNSAPQIYTVQEEPLYVELPDILPSVKNKVGNQVFVPTEKSSVVCNPNIKEASLSRSRKYTDPLPSRPPFKPGAKTDDGPERTGNLYDSHAVGTVREEFGESVILRNPHARDSGQTRSLPRDNHMDPTLTRALSCDHGTVTSCDGHCRDGSVHDVVHDVVRDPLPAEVNRSDSAIYQGLDDRKREQSIFVCSCCNDGSVYQRLSKDGSCSCAQQPKEADERKRQSIYASLSLERSPRESVYAPLGIGGAATAVEENEDDGDDAAPVYHMLEPEESESSPGLDTPDLNQDCDEASVNHDYNVLEEELGEEVEETASRELGDNCDANKAHLSHFQPLDYLALERAPTPIVPRRAKVIVPCNARRRAST